ncbi:MAG: sugar transferase [Slackia isoflavoniconvertens]|nr:sugar transferase [Slackia isoflavoniconvertens]
MSVVGPRPALPNEVATYNDYQRQRLLVKPGMTCYWQTRRNRDSITFDEWVDLDLWENDEIASMAAW